MSNIQQVSHYSHNKSSLLDMNHKIVTVCQN